jgi:hypothetical protein
MRRFGKVEIPQSAFIVALKIGRRLSGALTAPAREHEES